MDVETDNIKTDHNLDIIWNLSLGLVYSINELIHSVFSGNDMDIGFCSKDMYI